jgi:hypothetical protein
MLPAYVNFVWASPTRELDIVDAGNETCIVTRNMGLRIDASRRLLSHKKKLVSGGRLYSHKLRTTPPALDRGSPPCSGSSLSSDFHFWPGNSKRDARSAETPPA